MKSKYIPGDFIEIKRDTLKLNLDFFIGEHGKVLSCMPMKNGNIYTIRIMSTTLDVRVHENDIELAGCNTITLTTKSVGNA